MPLLTGDGETKWGVYLVLRRSNARELVETAKVVAPRLRAALAPCGPEAIRLALQPLALLYGVPPGRTNKMWDVIYGEYYDSLGQYPVAALVAGCKAYRDNPESRFFPLPGQLKKLVEAESVKLHVAAYRAKQIAEAEERIPAPPPSEADKAKVKELLGEFLSGQVGKAKTLDPTRPRGSRSSMAENLRRRADLEDPKPSEPVAPGESELFD